MKNDVKEGIIYIYIFFTTFIEKNAYKYYSNNKNTSA